MTDWPDMLAHEELMLRFAEAQRLDRAIARGRRRQQNRVVNRWNRRAGTLNSYIGFSRKHQQGMWALGQFNKGYRAITADGTLRRLKTEWLQKLR